MIAVINLEANMPTVQAARLKLEQALRTAKARKAPALKVIHGYGSSGRGGAIKADVHALLRAKQAAAEIKAFAPGEEFSPFYAAARKLIDACPELARDRDFTKANHGITVVLI
jgi:polyphosphate kinase 2 (PPK2 family)